MYTRHGTAHERVYCYGTSTLITIFTLGTILCQLSPIDIYLLTVPCLHDVTVTQRIKKTVMEPVACTRVHKSL
jgi:hypothetical protein